MRYRKEFTVHEVSDMSLLGLIRALGEANQSFKAEGFDNEVSVWAKIDGDDLVFSGSRRATPEEEPDIAINNLKCAIGENKSKIAWLENELTTLTKGGKQ